MSHLKTRSCRSHLVLFLSDISVDRTIDRIIYDAADLYLDYSVKKALVWLKRYKSMFFTETRHLAGLQCKAFCIGEQSQATLGARGERKYTH